MTHEDLCVGSVPRSTGKAVIKCASPGGSEAAGSKWVLPLPGCVTPGKFLNFSFMCLVVIGHMSSRGCCKDGIC